MAAFLAVPDAIRFQAEHDGDQVRADCHALAGEAKQEIMALSGLPAFQPEEPQWYAQMVAIPLPKADLGQLYQRLLSEYNIEVPIFTWNEHPLTRVSIQAYNTPEQVDKYVGALRTYLAEEDRVTATPA